jgi:aspartate kinase
MKIIVMKFGGSSLADPEKIKVTAERAIKTRAAGFAVALTVSAPADLTDDLIVLSDSLTAKSAGREHDALLSAGETISAALTAMAINACGVAAVSLSAAQAGIRTDSRHGCADISAVGPARILRELKKGRITVIAGFQGINAAGDITTLGRGGSDLTAVALAHALKAERCELYTDVRGVYTANPAVVPSARMLRTISYCDMLELARSGTEIRQLRAVIYAKKHNIVLHLRSAFETGEGTLVCNFPAGAGPQVTGFSIQKSADSAMVYLIGSRLNFPGIKTALRTAAAAGGHNLTGERYTPGRITLTTGFRDGERLLRTLHKEFIE